MHEGVLTHERIVFCNVIGDERKERKRREREEGEGAEEERKRKRGREVGKDIGI